MVVLLANMLGAVDCWHVVGGKVGEGCCSRGAI